MGFEAQLITLPEVGLKNQSRGPAADWQCFIVTVSCWCGDAPSVLCSTLCWVLLLLFWGFSPLQTDPNKLKLFLLLHRVESLYATSPPVLLRMDTGPASPPSSRVAGPPPLWRLAERRSRKTGSGNIFSNVNLWQLQRLFRAAGDKDAEQRAQLVWGQRDEAELAQALMGLRARTHRRGLRSSGRDALESRWLRSFNHLR